jgi:hypothetical protein
MIITTPLKLVFSVQPSHSKGEFSVLIPWSVGKVSVFSRLHSFFVQSNNYPNCAGSSFVIRATVQGLKWLVDNTILDFGFAISECRNPATQSI